ncbi:ABC transporter ATP-binding protein [Cellulomonas cellasea]|uniref:ABC-2 type transport system ATP-binding protein n=1 Tax=Cellulomonas cellasea TaxID=43670 RepID=A0A7W4UEM2_9CELL|nr:ABC transporter ATP-binding protein [Cellulomonas cellasea]MBB2922399.1 ABC-2 type transport system ATP-binding protein [Cellulomonas cellasea]
MGSHDRGTRASDEVVGGPRERSGRHAGPAPGTPAVRTAGLRVVRGGRRGTVVLPGLDVTVPAGQVVGLLGPSGSGKSTFLRAVVGVQEVAGGVVEVLGLPAGSPALRHRVGYVTQSPSVYTDLTVTENLRYFGAVVGAPPGDVARVLDDVDLTRHARRRTGGLSGGELARVSLAAALLGSPDLLVLDEPTVGLDPVLRRDLWDLFRRLRDGGTTLLVSSHVMDEATRCDRLLLLREGRLVADTDLPELLARTGAADVEHAFLTLVERDAAVGVR